MDHEGWGNHTLAGLLDNLLGLFLGLEEGLNALRLSGLNEIRIKSSPPKRTRSDYHRTVDSSGGGEGCVT